MMKAKKTYSYRDINCDSKEEYNFLIWLFKLENIGFKFEVSRSESFLLSPKQTKTITTTKVLKTKTVVKESEQTILREHNYTPEFRIRWLKKPFKTGLDFIDDESTSYIEVKPNFDFNNMTRAFKINQKWVYDKYEVLVNLIKPEILFQKTFTPTEISIPKTGNKLKGYYQKWERIDEKEWKNKTLFGF